MHHTSSAVQRPPQLRWTWGDVVWYRVVLLCFLHLQLPISVFVLFRETSLATFAWAFFVTVYGGMGVTIGAHRFWAHRSFKANRAFEILAMLCFCSNFQDDVITWVTTHRAHHRHSDTDCDPHDSRRGFFFSHVGWLLLKESPQVQKARAGVDLSDLLSNPVLIFNRKYIYPLSFLLTFVVPVMVPWTWGEKLWVSYQVAFVFRYTYILHGTFTVNSLAHLYGTKPYDHKLNARQNSVVTFLTTGEGWHNYHHVFPHDYRASEFPWFYNLSAVIIDFFAWIGWVSNRRTVSKNVIKKRILRTGDFNDEKHN